MLSNNNNFFFLIIFILINAISGCATQTAVDSDLLSLTYARYAHAAVNDGNKIYIFAGSSKSGFRSDIEIIDPSTKAIEVISDRLIRRRFFSAVWDGKHSIYIIGGVSAVNRKTKFENRVEIFDTITREVRLVKSHPFPTRINSAVFLNGRIFVFGGSYIGSRGLKVSSIVTAFDVDKNEWIRLADMPTAKETRAVAKDGFVYVVGGYNEVKSMNVFERYDPNTNVWKSLPAIPEGISAHSATVVKDKLFLFGNYNDLTSTYSYDFIKQQWKKINIGYKASRHNAATTLNDTTYVIGGVTGSKGSSSLDYIQTFKL